MRDFRRYFAFAILLGVGSSAASGQISGDCGGEGEVPIPGASISGTQANIQTFSAGPATDLQFYDATCSISVTVPQGQKFIVLTEQWNYALVPYWPQGDSSADFAVSLTGVPQPYSSIRHGDLFTPAPAPWISSGSNGGGSYWYLNVANAFDVSSLTQQHAVQVTLRLQISNAGFSNIAPISVDLGLYCGTSLKLTQTSSTFRPRDARDNAAQCGSNAGDCHPQFTATLTGLENADDILSPTITFTLTPATPSSPAGTWLTGTSTNYAGASNDTAANADYLFESSAQPPASQPNLTVQDPLTMQTNPGSIPFGEDENGNPTPAPPIPITVTSHDFGGKAYLRAALTLAPGMAPIYAEVVDASGNDVAPPVNNAAIKGTCGTDFAQHQFARLPVDQDCNGIADSWEGQYTTPTGGHLDPTADTDHDTTGTNANGCGVTATGVYPPPGSCGDGFSVFDEYRGLHTIDDSTGDPKWISTDPTKLDVFYWDSSSEDINKKLFAPGIQALLIPQTNGFIAWHQLNQLEARSKMALYLPAPGDEDPTNPYSVYSGVRQLNANNPVDQTADTPVVGYALWFVNGDVDEAANGCIGSLELGLSSNLGRGASGVAINSFTIAQCASRYGVDPSVMTSVVLAHETGHQFALPHYSRQAYVINSSVPIANTQYTRQWVTVDVYTNPGLPAGTSPILMPQVTGLFNVYYPSPCLAPGPNTPVPQSCPQWADSLETSLVYTPNDFQVINTVHNDVLMESRPNAAGGGALSLVNMNFGQPWLNVGTIFVNQQENFLMDWSQRWLGGPSFRTRGFWTFKPTDLQTLCVQCRPFVP
jgi:hypothetical protein